MEGQGKLSEKERVKQITKGWMLTPAALPEMFTVEHLFLFLFEFKLRVFNAFAFCSFAVLCVFVCVCVCARACVYVCV